MNGFDLKHSYQVYKSGRGKSIAYQISVKTLAKALAKGVRTKDTTRVAI